MSYYTILSSPARTIVIFRISLAATRFSPDSLAFLDAFRINLERFQRHAVEVSQAC